jgi:hypothetical protein
LINEYPAHTRYTPINRRELFYIHPDTWSEYAVPFLYIKRALFLLRKNMLYHSAKEGVSLKIQLEIYKRYKVRKAHAKTTQV